MFYISTIKQEQYTMTTQEAINADFLNNPKFHTNPVTGLKTALVKFQDWDDDGRLDPHIEIYTITD